MAVNARSTRDISVYFSAYYIHILKESSNPRGKKKGGMETALYMQKCVFT